MAKSQKKAKTKAFAATKRMITPNDGRIVKPAKQAQHEERERKKRSEQQQKQNHVTQVSSALFFAHNESLGPPYHVLIDTNFINFSIQNKLDIMRWLMDALLCQGDRLHHRRSDGGAREARSQVPASRCGSPRTLASHGPRQ